LADYSNSIFRVLPDSDVVRVNSNRLVQVFESGTDTLVWEENADQNGFYEISSLPTGHYDTRVDGVRVESFHHVKADHTHNIEPTWVWHKTGTISADMNQDDDVPIFYPGVAGTIIRLTVTAHYVTSGGDIRVHLLAGSGSSQLTFASDSQWEHQVNPGSVTYGYYHVDSNPGITIAATERVAMGLDYTATTVQGVTLTAAFRQS